MIILHIHYLMVKDGPRGSHSSPNYTEIFDSRSPSQKGEHECGSALIDQFVKLAEGWVSRKDVPVQEAQDELAGEFACF